MKKYLNKEHVIALLYELSDDYIAVNYDKDSTDGAWNAGLKAGIEGFRKYMLHYLLSMED